MNSMSLDNLVDADGLSLDSSEAGQVPTADPDNTGTDLQKSPEAEDQSSVQLTVSDPGPFKKTLVAFYVEDECKVYKELSAEEKAKSELKKDRREARHSATIFLSELYAMLLILIGLVFPVTEALLDKWQTNGVVTVFLMYLTTVSSVVIIYILLENEQTKKKRHKRQEAKEREQKLLRAERKQREQEERNNGVVVTPQEGDIIMSESLEPVTRERTMTMSSVITVDRSKPSESLSNDTTAMDEDVVNYIRLNTQMASQAHEGTSFYLRFGCLLFAIAYILFIALEIEYFYSGDRCHFTEKYPWVLFFHLIFVVVQTFFLFKHSKLLTERRKKLTRFGLMHIIATNFVVWIRALVSEIKSGVSGQHHGGDVSHDYNYTDPNNTSSNCSESFVEKASHYLFPFILEYCLIAVATFLSMFMSLDIRISGDVFRSIRRYLRVAKKEKEKLVRGLSPDGEPEVHKMLDKAHTGMFIGVIILTGTIISFILTQYNVASATDENGHKATAEIVYHSTDLCLHILALGALALAFYKLLNLRHSLLRRNIIDNLLMVLSMCGLILYELFKVVAFIYIIKNDYISTDLILQTVCSLVIPIQAFLQTPFIISAMTRYSDRKEDRLHKPGRGVITFLLLINICIWLHKSFTESLLSVQLMESFYGLVPWQIIMNITLPLMLFYRFHSSVCLADTWVSIYENEESPIHYMDL